MRQAIVLLIFISGCSTNAPKLDAKTERLLPQIDTQCDQIAYYARTTETLKAVGVNEHEIQEFVHPGVSPLYHTVRRHIYRLSFSTPAEAYTKIYDKCVLMGYVNLANVISQEEIQATVKEERVVEAPRKSLPQKHHPPPKQDTKNPTEKQIQQIVEEMIKRLNAGQGWSTSRDGYRFQ